MKVTIIILNNENNDILINKTRVSKWLSDNFSRYIFLNMINLVDFFLLFFLFLCKVELILILLAICHLGLGQARICSSSGSRTVPLQSPALPYPRNFLQTPCSQPSTSLNPPWPTPTSSSSSWQLWPRGGGGGGGRWGGEGEVRKSQCNKRQIYIKWLRWINYV